jgi:hypothetical protein
MFRCLLCSVVLVPDAEGCELVLFPDAVFGKRELWDSASGTVLVPEVSVVGEPCGIGRNGLMIGPSARKKERNYAVFSALALAD